MSKVRTPRGATHYFQLPDGAVTHFLDSRVGAIFDSSGNLFVEDAHWSGAEGVERMSNILTRHRVVKVNTRLENK